MEARLSQIHLPTYYLHYSQYEEMVDWEVAEEGPQGGRVGIKPYRYKTC